MIPEVTNVADGGKGRISGRCRPVSLGILLREELIDVVGVECMIGSAYEYPFVLDLHSHSLAYTLHSAVLLRAGPGIPISSRSTSPCHLMSSFLPIPCMHAPHQFWDKNRLSRTGYVNAPLRAPASSVLLGTRAVDSVRGRDRSTACAGSEEVSNASPSSSPSLLPRRSMTARPRRTHAFRSCRAV